MTWTDVGVNWRNDHNRGPGVPNARPFFSPPVLSRSWTTSAFADARLMTKVRARNHEEKIRTKRESICPANSRLRDLRVSPPFPLSLSSARICVPFVTIRPFARRRAKSGYRLVLFRHCRSPTTVTTMTTTVIFRYNLAFESRCASYTVSNKVTEGRRGLSLFLSYFHDLAFVSSSAEYIGKFF